MDTHFKILRAREEIERLNVEVRRVATQLHDEDLFLRTQEDIINAINPPLAHQIAVSALCGFTGTASVGVALEALDTVRDRNSTREL